MERWLISEGFQKKTKKLLCTRWAFFVVFGFGLVWFFSNLLIFVYFLVSHFTALAFATYISSSRKVTWNNNPKVHGPSKALTTDIQE